MRIRVNVLYRDMINFLLNNFFSIILLSLLSSIAVVTISHLLSPGKEQLIIINDSSFNSDSSGISIVQSMKNTSLQQKKMLLCSASASAISSLIGDILLTGSLLTIIHLSSNHQYIKVLRVFSLSALLMPRLLFLTLLTTILIELGVFFFIVPGILMILAFSLSPIIISQENIGIFKSIYLSTNIAFSNVRIIGSAILPWILSKFLIVLISIQYFSTHTLITEVFFSTLSNLISSMLLIYLFRFYMLLGKNEFR